MLSRQSVSHWKLSILCLVALLAACGAPNKPRSADAVPQPVQEDKVQHKIANPAVKQLWDQSNVSYRSGNLDTAVTQLERALRIDPEDPAMWSRLAEFKIRQNNPGQAETLARKSNALTADNPVLTYRNWLIIEAALRQMGDTVGADEASYIAESLKLQLQL